MPERPEVMAGDTVLIQATVLEAVPGVGVRVELFSKTDQYQAWIREDLLQGRVVVAYLPPEPPDGAWLAVEETPDREATVLCRRDARAPVEPARRLPRRWRDVGAGEWVDWPAAVGRGADPAARLVPDVDVIGPHRVTQAHYCQTCGHPHSPEEIERARQQAAEEAERRG